MFGSLLFIFSVLSFHFLPTYLLPFPPSLSLGFYQSSCSKVIKGQHIEGALLGCVIFYSHALLFVFYFCLWWQTLSGRWARDKPSVVLCGEIIRQADKACWVSSSLLIRSSRHCLFLFPRWARKSPVGFRVIKPVCHVLPTTKCQPSSFDICNYCSFMQLGGLNGWFLHVLQDIGSSSLQLWCLHYRYSCHLHSQLNLYFYFHRRGYVVMFSPVRLFVGLSAELHKKLMNRLPQNSKKEWVSAENRPHYLVAGIKGWSWTFSHLL